MFHLFLFLMLGNDSDCLVSNFLDAICFHILDCHLVDASDFLLAYTVVIS